MHILILLFHLLLREQCKSLTNDPIHHGTDHTREMVPFICYHKHINGRALPDFDTFANVGATICDNFNCEMPKLGTSVLGEITK